jgi:hypothetical protein
MTTTTDFSALVHELMVKDLGITAFMRELVDAHVRAAPDQDWKALEGLDFDELDLLHERWLVPCFKREAPRSRRVKAISCGLFAPIRNDVVTTDMYVAGTTRFELNEVPREWNVSPAYFPMMRQANSRVLKELPRGHHFLALGYAAKTIALLLARADLDAVLGKRKDVQVVVGWDSGDPLHIGRLERTGFIPTTLEEARASLAEQKRLWDAHHEKLKQQRETFRIFQHPDGRRWAIAVTDDSIVLRFTDGDGDEYTRTRNRERDEKMAKVADALVEEQIRDGFVEAKV